MKPRESKSLPKYSYQTPVSQSTKMTKSIGSNKNHDIYAGSKGKLNPSSKRCLTTASEIMSPVKPNVSDTISNTGIPKKIISQESSNTISTNTRNESVSMTASKFPTDLQNNAMPTPQLELDDPSDKLGICTLCRLPQPP